MKYLPILMLFALSSCQTPAVEFSRITKIEYRFDDSSVPPQYHRSYSITVTEQELRIVVDSYGDILADKKYHIDTARFTALLLDLEKLGIKTGAVRVSQGCDGGTGEELKCWAGQTSVLSGYVGHCGGQDTGNLYGDVPAFAKSLKALIPDFASLVK
jgi:hypothetical protein